MGFGIFYATTSLLAEIYYVAAWERSPSIAQAVSRLEAARATFPFDYRFRRAVAELYSKRRWPGSAEPAIAALRAALVMDPNAADLHRNLASYLWEAGRRGEATDEITIFHRIAPKEDVVLVVNVNPATR